MSKPLLGAVALATMAATACVPVFYEPFDGAPDAPLVFEDENWDVALMSRDRETWVTADPGNTAQHGVDCAGPPARHPVNTLEEAVFVCRDHLMTAVNSDSFGVATLTPAHVLDLSAEGNALVRFDLSTARNGGYDWVEITITPFEDNLVHPAAEIWQVAGPPDNALTLALIPGEENRFTLTGYRDGVATEYSSQDSWIAYDTEQLPFEPSAMRRDTFEVRITDEGLLRFGMVGYPDPAGGLNDFFWFEDVDVSPIDWSAAVVQFQHFSFNPTNNCGDASCDGDTWHWDNVVLYPATPFTMVGSEQRWIDPALDDRSWVDFTAASGPGAHLRFSAIGSDMELSFDGGATWEPAQLQREAEDTEVLEGRFRNYWHPIPDQAEVNRVHVRGGDWWGGSWHARDFSLWSLAEPETR